MAKETKSLSDLKDSRILYEKNPPYFGYLIVLIVSGLLVCVLIWSFLTSKIYIVKGNGIIESVNKNYIMSSYSGEISEMRIQNGDYIEKGELLFLIKSTDLSIQQIQIEGNIEIYKKQIEQFKKLQKSIEDNINYFNAQKPDDSLYYNQFEAYKSQVAQCVIDVDAYKQYGYTDVQIEVEVKKNEGKISEIYHSTLKSIGESITNVSTELESAKIQGDAIGSIANENDTYIIKSYVNVNDVPLINTGDSVDIAVAGLVESVYGTIPGKLVRIDSDITSQQSNNGNGQSGSESEGSYFRLDIEPNVNYLVSKSGRKSNLSNGTVVEVRIKYDRINQYPVLLFMCYRT